MQDVNNDMDDLFREASGHYPLRTDGKDWNKVLQGLQQQDDDDVASPLPAVANANKNSKRKALWLLLLLPLSLWFVVTYNHSASKQELAKKEVTTEKNKKLNSGFGQDQSQSSSQTENSKNTTASLLKKEVQSRQNFSEQEQNNPEDQNGFSKVDKTTPSIKTSTSFQSDNNQKKESLIAENEIASSNQNLNSTTKQPDSSLSRIDNTNTSINNLSASSKKEVSDSAKSKIEKAGTSADSSAASQTAKTTRKWKAQIENKKGFYVGLLGSFDMSTVKLQKITKTGYGLDVLIGYRFSKRVSVESGIGLTSKSYYSKGEYFDKSRTDISPDSKIIYANGVCNMIEVPLSLKYDFTNGRRSHFYATAGLSSYFMKKEKYNYYADHNGWYYSADKNYKNSGNNLFSVASLSAGYQYNLSKHTSLRAEPYIKMPLTGIGIAKLPITSTGVTVGITRSF